MKNLKFVMVKGGYTSVYFKGVGVDFHPEFTSDINEAMTLDYETVQVLKRIIAKMNDKYVFQLFE